MTGRKLITEMAVIVLLAALVGIAWNHRLLYRAWTGQAPATIPAAAPVKARHPFPLGLMQARELFDRQEAFFVDARDRGAFAAGHIRDAVSLPLGEADAELAGFRQRVPVTAPLVVYCNGYACHDSADLGERLLRAGYRTVYVFAGGYPEWQDAAYPTAGGSR